MGQLRIICLEHGISIGNFVKLCYCRHKFVSRNNQDNVLTRIR